MVVAGGLGLGQRLGNRKADRPAQQAKAVEILTDTRHDEVKPNPPTTSEAAVVQDNQSSSAPSSTVTTTPTTPATAVDNLLLSAGEIGRLLGGIEVSSEPGGTVGAALKLDSSSYGPGDHSRQVEPVSCVGIAFTGDKASYGGTDVEALKTEEFSPGTYAAGDQGPTQLEQTVAVLDRKSVV